MEKGLKLLICGSRKLGTPADYRLLKRVIEQYVPGVTSILHGGARGMDGLAQVYAIAHDLHVGVIRPNYQAYRPKLAPLQRNSVLVEQCDWCIAFYGKTRSGGTLDTATKALAANKLLVEVVDGRVYAYDPVLTRG